MAPETSLDENFLIARGRVSCLGPWGWSDQAQATGAVNKYSNQNTMGLE